MSASQTVSLAACAGQLALAMLCVSRATRSPLAVPLALLCLAIFGWTGADLAYQLSGVEAWRWIDHALTPWTAPLALHFVLTFVGRSRELRRVLLVASVPAAVLGAISMSAFAVVPARGFIGSQTWSTLLVSVAVPTMAFAGVVLARHWRESIEPTERTRARLILYAVAIGTLLGLTDELGQYDIPSLGSVGMLATCALLSFVALRLRLFGREASLRAAAYPLAIAGASVVAALIGFRFLSSSTAMAIFVASMVSVAIVAASRQWLAGSADARARREQLATLGRFSAQMAHDLKNPLAALKGAAQLMQEDLARPSPAVDRGRFAALMIEQIERIDTLVDVYGRLARVQPERRPLDVDAAVRDVLALHSLPSNAVVVKTELAGNLPPCSADAAMLARVLENLVRNAIEAMPEGGSVVVRTCAEASGVVLSVADTGCGMDARTRERAFDDFFTTKPSGSGLGLAFVRRIVDAHGGDVSLSSEPGRGTVVRVRLPVG